MPRVRSDELRALRMESQRRELQISLQHNTNAPNWSFTLANEWSFLHRQPEILEFSHNVCLSSADGWESWARIILNLFCIMFAWADEWESSARIILNLFCSRFKYSFRMVNFLKPINCSASPGRIHWLDNGNTPGGNILTWLSSTNTHRLILVI